MFKIIGSGGDTREFDARSFAADLQDQLGVSRALARALAQEAAQTFAEQETVSAEALTTSVARSALAQTTSAALISSPALLTSSAFSASSALDLAKGAATFAKDLIKKDWVAEPGNEWVKEIGSPLLFLDDDKAPTMSDFKRIGGFACCVKPLQGVMVELSITVSDDGAIGNDSGVRWIRLFGVNGNGTRANLEGESSVKLTDAENDKTQGGDVTKTFKVCIPCAFITGESADIWIEITDDDDNIRIARRAIALHGWAKHCCQGGPKPGAAKPSAGTGTTPQGGGGGAGEEEESK